MAQDFKIDDSDLRRFLFGLNQADKKIISRSGRYVKVLTKYTKRKMKQFSKSRKSRSSGNLSSSIKSEYFITKQGLSSEIFVPESVKYQFASEYGIRTRSLIKGRPKMTFSTDAWKNAGKGLVSLSHRGYFVFAQVKRGKYKGRFFTRRAFEALLKYYDSRLKDKFPEAIIRALSFGR